MKEYSKEILKDAANRLLFDMLDEEYDTLLKEFDIIIRQMSLLGNDEDIDSYAPATFPFECSTDYLRDDVPSTPIKQEEALKNAHSKEDGQIKLPKVV